MSSLLFNLIWKFIYLQRKVTLSEMNLDKLNIFSQNHQLILKVIPKDFGSIISLKVFIK